MEKGTGNGHLFIYIMYHVFRGGHLGYDGNSIGTGEFKVFIIFWPFPTY